MADMHTTEDSSTFTAVKPRKKRKNKNPKASPQVSDLVAAAREQLGQSEWFAQCSQILENAWRNVSVVDTPFCEAKVLCLGLGSPSASQIARVQLAFLTEACKRLKVAHDMVFVYDPVFTTEDKELFKELQMIVLSETRSADYALKVPTIYFMPHCDLELYEAVLRAIWNPKDISNVLLLGNQLQEYIDNRPISTLESKAPCLLRAVPFLESQSLPIPSPWPTAFNNTSVQYWRRSSQSDLPDDLFEELPWQE